MKPDSKRLLRVRGFTLLEIVIAAVLFLLVLALSLGMFFQQNQSMGESMAVTDTALRANNLDAMLKEQLRGATTLAGLPDNGTLPLLTGAGLSPTGNFTSITFRVPIPPGYDYTTGNATLDARRHQILFQFDPAEDTGGAGNNADDDNDGFIDEGVIELRRDNNGDLDFDDPGELLVTLARDVASAIEIYPTTGPSGTRINMRMPGVALDGQRGAPLRFEYTSGGASPLATDQDLKIEFAILKRLPTAGAIHHEVRDITISLRNRP